MNTFTVIDGEVRKMDCFAGDCYGDALFIRDFVNYFSSELSIKDLYFVTYNRDEVHFETVRESMSPFENKNPYIRLPTTRPATLSYSYQHFG